MSSPRRDQVEWWFLPFGFGRTGAVPSWKDSKAFLYVAAMIAVLAIEYFLGVQPVAIWLSFVAFPVVYLIYLILTLVLFRKR